MMCLMKDPTVYNEIVDNFGLLPDPARKFLKEKFESILKIVVKQQDAVAPALEQLYKKIQASEGDAFAIEYTTLLNTLKEFVRKQGICI